MTSKAPPRALYAAGLLAAALTVLLVAWFLSGWHDVRARQREASVAPANAAEQRAGELARELRGQLAVLMTREVQRPYFVYQNLFHDPKASTAWSVAPSPLADAPADPLVLGYFQLDTKAHVTTPTINDDVPELSDAKHLAENRAFRAEVVRSLAVELAPSRPGTVVAQAIPASIPGDPRPDRSTARSAMNAPSSSAAPNALRESNAQAGQVAQVVQIDPNTYVQNSFGNAAYWRAQVPAPDAAHVPARPTPTPRPPAPPARPNPVSPRNRLPAPTSTIPTGAVTITVSPLEWRTLAFAGAPALLAVREVQTPDGSITQGFVVDRATLTGWLASRADNMVAELRAGEGGTATEIAPGWHLSVAPNPRALAQAVVDAARVGRDFLIRFVGVGLVAALAASMVVLLVVRAERLARERSHFAAAAAHELRTPLAGLQLYGDMLADGLGDPAKARDYARRMSEEASRLGRVVSNVLGFSQLERGNLSVDAHVDVLGTALRELAERAQPALDRAGAALDLDIEPDVRARFDRDALARIVGNLLDNAEKYARGAEDRTITLATHDLGSVVEVVITDRGPGVAPRTALFQPFSRGVSGDGPAGLGLGLALSQSLARAMGGDLVYRPAAGSGATFALRLPRA